MKIVSRTQAFQEKNG